MIWYRSSPGHTHRCDPYLTKDDGFVGGTPRMASFRLRAWPFHPHLALRMEKALIESFWSLGGRGGGVPVDCCQCMLLCLPPGTIYIFLKDIYSPCSLLVFFFTSSRLTKWRGQDKRKLEEDFKEGV